MDIFQDVLYDLQHFFSLLQTLTLNLCNSQLETGGIGTGKLNHKIEMRKVGSYVLLDIRFNAAM